MTAARATARTLTASILALAVLHVIFGETLTRWLPLWSGSPGGRPYWSRGIGLALAAAAAWLLVKPRTVTITLALSGDSGLSSTEIRSFSVTVMVDGAPASALRRSVLAGGGEVSAG